MSLINIAIIMPWYFADEPSCFFIKPVSRHVMLCLVICGAPISMLLSFLLQHFKHHPKLTELGQKAIDALFFSVVSQLKSNNIVKIKQLFTKLSEDDVKKLLKSKDTQSYDLCHHICESKTISNEHKLELTSLLIENGCPIRSLSDGYCHCIRRKDAKLLRMSTSVLSQVRDKFLSSDAVTKESFLFRAFKTAEEVGDTATTKALREAAEGCLPFAYHKDEQVKKYAVCMVLLSLVVYAVFC
jgi:hypothetical protein